MNREKWIEGVFLFAASLLLFGGGGSFLWTGYRFPNTFGETNSILLCLVLTSLGLFFLIEATKRLVRQPTARTALLPGKRAKRIGSLVGLGICALSFLMGFFLLWLGYRYPEHFSSTTGLLLFVFLLAWGTYGLLQTVKSIRGL